MIGTRRCIDRTSFYHVHWLHLLQPLASFRRKAGRTVSGSGGHHRASLHRVGRHHHLWLCSFGLLILVELMMLTLLLLLLLLLLLFLLLLMQTSLLLLMMSLLLLRLFLLLLRFLLSLLLMLLLLLVDVAVSDAFQPSIE